MIDLKGVDPLACAKNLFLNFIIIVFTVETWLFFFRSVFTETRNSCEPENKLLNDSKQQATGRSFLVPLRVPDLGLHKMDLLYAFSSA